MLIKDMFKKPIDRDIKGVIVVGEGEDSNAKQELEEYVVTRELSKHFRENPLLPAGRAKAHRRQARRGLFH